MVNKTPFELNEEIGFEIVPYDLSFHKPARTSRDVLNHRSIFFVKVFYKSAPQIFGIGECAPIYGLNPEREEEVQSLLKDALDNIAHLKIFNPKNITQPAIRFAIETAIYDLIQGGNRILFNQIDKNAHFPINGLVWMNQYDTMLQEAMQKVESGYKVIKLKIGGIDFEDEINIIKTLREKFGNRITIRLDANGAFTQNEALNKLNRLAEFDIHSIEQPIKAGQVEAMAQLCNVSPIPIALDEELIGIDNEDQKRYLIETISPQFIILKPTLHGGFSGCDEWIEIAEKQNVSWWATSALESSVGLNAIAQWLLPKNVLIEQGLGTGSLYSNNLSPAWIVNKGNLEFDNVEALNKDIYSL